MSENSNYELMHIEVKNVEVVKENISLSECPLMTLFQANDELIGLYLDDEQFIVIEEGDVYDTEDWEEDGGCPVVTAYMGELHPVNALFGTIHQITGDVSFTKMKK